MKNLLMTTELTKKPFEVNFQSGHEYNKLYNILMEENKQNNDIDIQYQDDQLLVKQKDIRSLVFSKQYLEGGNTPFTIKVVFEDGNKINIPVLGEKRARNNYNRLRMFFGKRASKKVMVIYQDKAKKALIRHYTVIKELKVTEDDSE